MVCAIAAVVVMGLGAVPAQAQGSQNGGPPPVTEYGTYPAGLIPDGCTAQGEELLVGEQYTVDGVTSSSLRNFATIAQDAIVTMTWTGFAPGCEGVGISLSRKISGQTNFDPSDNQYLNVWAYCGPGGTPCTAPFSLTLDLGLSPQVACYQMDANAGPPLNIVGPAGTFYSSNPGGFNTLISAHNGGTGSDCTPPPCPTNPNLPAQSWECIETATTETTAPPTTQPPTTQPPTTASTTPPSTVTTSGQSQTTVSTATTGPTVSVLPTISTRQALPFTGNSSDSMRLALGLIVGGALLLVAAWRWRDTTTA